MKVATEKYSYKTPVPTKRNEFLTVEVETDIHLDKSGKMCGHVGHFAMEIPLPVKTRLGLDSNVIHSPTWMGLYEVLRNVIRSFEEMDFVPLIEPYIYYSFKGVASQVENTPSTKDLGFEKAASLGQKSAVEVEFQKVWKITFRNGNKKYVTSDPTGKDVYSPTLFEHRSWSGGTYVPYDENLWQMLTSINGLIEAVVMKFFNHLKGSGAKNLLDFAQNQYKQIE